MEIQEPGSNLYKWLAILGVAIIFASISAMGTVLAKHDAVALEYYKLLGSMESLDGNEVQESVTRFVTQSLDTTNFSMRLFAYTGLFGFLISAVGCVLWYRKIQRHVDRQLASHSASSNSS